MVKFIVLFLLGSVVSVEGNNCSDWSRVLRRQDVAEKGVERIRAEWASDVVLDTYEKRRILTELGFDDSQRDIILRTGYLRGEDVISIQDAFLREAEISPDKIEFLRKRGLLEGDPWEYQRLTSVALIDESNILPGASVSRVNENGNFENVVVSRVEDNRVYVKSLGNPQEEVLLKSETYAPIIARRREVLRMEENGLPKRVTMIVRHQTTIDQLILRPKGRISMEGDDFSQPISSGVHMREEAEAAAEIFLRDKESKEFIQANNSLMIRMQEEMRRQGIFSELTPSKKGSLSLVINGVHPNGNRVARSYMVRANLVNVQKMTVSLVNSNGRIKRGKSRGGHIIFSVQGTIDMLSGKSNSIIFHEFDHEMFNARVAANRMSYFDDIFEVIDRQETQYTRLSEMRDLFGVSANDVRYGERLYSQQMVLGEVYTYSLEIPFLLGRVDSSNDTYSRDIVFQEMGKKVGRVKQLSNNAINVFKDMLESLHWNDMEMDENNLVMTDPQRGWRIKMVLSLEERRMLTENSRLLYGRQLNIGHVGNRFEERRKFLTGIHEQAIKIDAILGRGLADDDGELRQEVNHLRLLVENGLLD